MALQFGAATTDRITCGTGTSISDLPEWTYCAWVYPTTFTSLRLIYARSDANYLRLNGTSGYVQILRAYSTTNMNYIANSRPLTLNAWNFVSARMTTAKTGNLYVGTLTTPAVECTYSTSTAGVGTLTTEDATSPGITACIGNWATITPNRAFQGMIASVSVWRYAMPIWDIRSQQRNPQPGPGCVAFWRPGGRYGTAVQQDESGFANHGTVTGATANTLEPPLYILPPRRIWYVPEVVVAGTAVPVFYRHLQTQGIA